jgi:hypothetical protein
MTTFKYRVTIRTDDLAVLCAIRGLVHCSQKEGPVNTSWGGTGEQHWRDANHQVTFKFSRQQYRASFLADAARLLPSQWSKVSEDDDG